MRYPVLNCRIFSTSFYKITLVYNVNTATLNSKVFDVSV